MDNNNYDQSQKPASVSGNYFSEQMNGLMKITTVFVYWRFVSASTQGQTIEFCSKWTENIGAAPSVMVECLKNLVSKQTKDPLDSINILSYDWHFIMPGPSLSHFADKTETYNETMMQ